MNAPRLTLGLCGLVSILAGCSHKPPGPIATSPDGMVALLASVDGGADRNAARHTADELIATHRRFDALFAHSDDLAFGAGDFLGSNELQTRVVSIGAATQPMRAAIERGDIHGTVIEPTHASAALDLAIIAATGGAIERRDLSLGPRKISSETIRFDGAVSREPGDSELEELRTQHHQLLTTPGDKVFVRVGVSIGGGSKAWRERLRQDLDVLASEHAVDVDLQTRVAKRMPIQAGQVRELLALELDALILVPYDGTKGAELVASAKGTPVIVIGSPIPDSNYTCSVSTRPYVLGRAAAELCRGALGRDGGRVVELLGTGSARHAEVSRGFLETLGLHEALQPAQTPR